MLLPKEGLIFALHGPETYEALYGLRDDDAEVLRTLSFWVQSFRESNQSTVAQLTTAVKIAGLSLLAEIALLAAGLGLD